MVSVLGDITMKKIINNIIIFLGVLLFVCLFIFIPPFNKVTKGIKVEIAASINSDLFTNHEKCSALTNKAENYFENNNIEFSREYIGNIQEIDYQIKIDDISCDVSFQRWKEVNYLYINCYDIEDIDKQKIVDFYNEFNACQISTYDLERAINSNEDFYMFSLSNKAYAQWN